MRQGNRGTMSDPSTEDVESQQPSKGFYNGSRLQGHLDGFAKDLKELESRKAAKISENLFWYHEFGQRTRTKTCEPEDQNTFGDCLSRLDHVLKESRSTDIDSLQLL